MQDHSTLRRLATSIVDVLLSRKPFAEHVRRQVERLNRFAEWTGHGVGELDARSVLAESGADVLVNVGKRECFIELFRSAECVTSRNALLAAAKPKVFCSWLSHKPPKACARSFSTSGCVALSTSILFMSGMVQVG